MTAVLAGGRSKGAALVAVLMLSCARSGAPCAAPNCGPGYECLANTCTPLGAEPVSKDTTRIVLEPKAVAGSSGAETKAGSVDLGGEYAALYLRFDDGWKRDGALVRAFLLIEPTGEPEPGAEDREVHVWTVQGPWTPSRIAIGARPNLTSPHARGLLRSSPPIVARIDVTKLMLALAEKSEDNGLAVLGEPGQSAPVRTGSSGGAPRLELYLRSR
jgi:hypothetical protein